MYTQFSISRAFIQVEMKVFIKFSKLYESHIKKDTCYRAGITDHFCVIYMLILATVNIEHTNQIFNKDKIIIFNNYELIRYAEYLYDSYYYLLSFLVYYLYMHT